MLQTNFFCLYWLSNILNKKKSWNLINKSSAESWRYGLSKTSQNWKKSEKVCSFPAGILKFSQNSFHCREKKFMFGCLMLFGLDEQTNQKVIWKIKFPKVSDFLKARTNTFKLLFLNIFSAFLIGVLWVVLQISPRFQISVIHRKLKIILSLPEIYPPMNKTLLHPKDKTIHHEVTVLTFSLQVDEFVINGSNIRTLFWLTIDRWCFFFTRKGNLIRRFIHSKLFLRNM